MHSFKPSVSCCPKRMENTAPLPIQSPSSMEVRKVISVKADPTAASAFRAQKTAHNQRIRDIVALLQQIAQNHGNRKPQHGFHHIPLSQISPHLAFSFRIEIFILRFAIILSRKPTQVN